MIVIHDPEWTKIMLEVDRLYHINTTSEGRILCISDYIARLLNKLEASHSAENAGQAEGSKDADNL
jgi:hypothetical protein